MFSFSSDPIDIVITIISFIIIFTVVVVSHEFGHFIVARANGIGCQEFSIGMGPKLFKWNWAGTLFTVRLLPLGGACIFEGEDALDEEDEELSAKQEENPLEDVRSGEKGKFQNANVWSRIATVLAGPVFNIILAYLLGLIICGFCGEVTTEIGKVTEASPAYEAGLQSGDVITKINGERVYLFNEFILENYISGGTPWEIEYMREGENYVTTVTSVYNQEEGRYIFGVEAADKVNCANLNMFKYSFYEVRFWLKATFKSLKMLVTGKLNKDDLAGPVGVAQVINETVSETKQYGTVNMILNLINIALLLSVNLGIMNLLPIPALDGGRLLFLFVEAIIRRKLPRKAEAIIHAVGFILLLLLMVFVMFNDISKFFRF